MSAISVSTRPKGSINGEPLEASGDFDAAELAAYRISISNEAAVPKASESR